MHQYFHPVGAAVGKQISAARPSRTEFVENKSVHLLSSKFTYGYVGFVERFDEII
ncbi:hypothetical protein PS870_06303 [Pseudomonas fluorescens]|uniref:Uncharacterized protein n=1 Tax=Pseudomonas fluorescens TaxID=294 RepID=A0A5E7QK66_PSEFL|nr:hypothetical protein PS870_06303 [Pseudomonas fluorescens]